MGAENAISNCTNTATHAVERPSIYIYRYICIYISFRAIGNLTLCKIVKHKVTTETSNSLLIFCLYVQGYCHFILLTEYYKWNIILRLWASLGVQIHARLNNLSNDLPVFSSLS